MQNRYPLLPLILFSFIAVFGAGCVKKAETPKQPPTAPKSENPSVVVFQRTEQPNPTINAELERVLKNFRAAKSFRLKFARQTDKGSLTANLDFQKPKRFRGTIRIQNLPATELILVDQALYLRPGGASWVNLTGTEAARTLSESLNTVLSGEKSLDAVLVEPTAYVRKDRDPDRACDRYKTTSRGADGSVAALDICAKNGLPSYVQITTDNGPFLLEYYDYNALFLIEKPL